MLTCSRARGIQYRYCSEIFEVGGPQYGNERLGKNVQVKLKILFKLVTLPNLTVFTSTVRRYILLTTDQP